MLADAVRKAILAYMEHVYSRRRGWMNTFLKEVIKKVSLGEAPAAEVVAVAGGTTAAEAAGIAAVATLPAIMLGAALALVGSKLGTLGISLKNPCDEAFEKLVKDMAKHLQARGNFPAGATKDLVKDQLLGDVFNLINRCDGFSQYECVNHVQAAYVHNQLRQQLTGFRDDYLDYLAH